MKGISTPPFLMTPRAYAGEESVTFPNGLITKRGKTVNPIGAVAMGQETIAFDTAFPTALKGVTTTMVVTTLGHSARIAVRNPSVSGFIIEYNAGAATIDANGIFWTAEGY